MNFAKKRLAEWLRNFQKPEDSMFNIHSISSPNMILWAGYFYIGGLFLTVSKNLLDRRPVWGHFFSDNPGGVHHLSRYVLFFGSMALAARFLFGVLGADSLGYDGFMNEITAINKIIYNFNINETVGASGIAYLLSKVTNGQILSLFGRRSR